MYCMVYMNIRGLYNELVYCKYMHKEKITNVLLTPERHEHGIEDGSRMVKQIGQLRIETDLNKTAHMLKSC